MAKGLYSTIQTLPTPAAAGSLFLSKDLYEHLEPVIYNGGQFSLHCRTLSIKGADSQTFLQNQTTTNVVALENSSFQLNALLDISAKFVGFFHLLKVNSREFFLVSHPDFFQDIVERLEKYLIAEEVELKIVEKPVFGYMGTRCLENMNDEKAFKGIFAQEETLLSFTDHTRGSIDLERLRFLKIITGYPAWKETLHEKELFNNTVLVDLAYDKNKGCFLGQETVSKIESRRGAAFKPVLLKTSRLVKPQVLSSLKIGGKKAGKVLGSAEVGQETYILASLSREARIEGRVVEFEEPIAFKGKVLYLPQYRSSEKALGFFHFAVEKFQEGDEEKAEEFLLKAIKTDSSFEDAYESLGVLYGRQERYEKAIDLMSRLASLNEKSVMAHTNLSLYYMKIGQIEKAEEEKSLATIMQFENLGKEAERKRQLQEEEKRRQEEISKRESMFRQVLEIDPEDTLANYGLGEIEYMKGRFSKSIEHLQKTITQQKNYSVAWLQLAKSLLALEKHEQAKETLEKGIEIAGKNGDLMPANEMQRLLSELTVSLK